MKSQYKINDITETKKLIVKNNLITLTQQRYRNMDKTK